LAQELIEGRSPNISVVVATSDLPRTALVQNLANASLVLRYGFLGNLQSIFHPEAAGE
jgi:hypothetical protein